MLRAYLEYAESGGRSLPGYVAERPALNPFERDVGELLAKAGIPAIPRYGASGYFIDFAAQHPALPGKMVLAIEYDGEKYDRSQSARDRDRLRQEHLERLGWRFVRIWSSAESEEGIDPAWTTSRSPRSPWTSHSASWRRGERAPTARSDAWCGEAECPVRRQDRHVAGHRTAMGSSEGGQRVPGDVTTMRVLETRDQPYLDAAAQLWAEATAARDHDDEVAGLDLARPVIDAVLASSPRSRLFVGLAQTEQVLAFAAVEPLRTSETATAELRYLGVQPTQWGCGLGERLLRQVTDRLALLGFSRGELSVYTDNARAVALYEKLGWEAVGTPTKHPKTGKAEQRYGLGLMHCGSRGSRS
jgi:ribosomal protein S18 acetylase RimI-like enzyme